MTEQPGKTVAAPMAGSVHQILVSQGASIGRGDELVVLESMKMEIPVEAPVAGTVSQILVTVGQKVAEGDALMVIS